METVFSQLHLFYTICSRSTQRLLNEDGLNAKYLQADFWLGSRLRRRGFHNNGRRRSGNLCGLRRRLWLFFRRLGCFYAGRRGLDRCWRWNRGGDWCGHWCVDFGHLKRRWRSHKNKIISGRTNVFFFKIRENGCNCQYYDPGWVGVGFWGEGVGAVFA